MLDNFCETSLLD